MRKRIAFFEKMDKIDKSLAGSLRKKRYINTQNGGGRNTSKNSPLVFEGRFFKLY